MILEFRDIVEYCWRQYERLQGEMAGQEKISKTARVTNSIEHGGPESAQNSIQVRVCGTYRQSREATLRFALLQKKGFARYVWLVE
jgi:hypothetical protein